MLAIHLGAGPLDKNLEQLIKTSFKNEILPKIQAFLKSGNLEIRSGTNYNDRLESHVKIHKFLEELPFTSAGFYKNCGGGFS